MATETNVQIEVPRTGQKIRNLSASVVQSDGTIATVLMQVVALADDQGNLINLDTRAQLDDLLLVAKEIRGALLLLANELLNTTVDRDTLADL